MVSTNNYYYFIELFSSFVVANSYVVPFFVLGSIPPFILYLI